MPLLMACLLLSLSTPSPTPSSLITAAGCPSGLPCWVGPQPVDQSNASDSLALVAGRVTASIHVGSPSMGPYNHGPILTFWRGRYYISWYNSMTGEESNGNNRVLLATSKDGGSWSSPSEPGINR